MNIVKTALAQRRGVSMINPYRLANLRQLMHLFSRLRGRGPAASDIDLSQYYLHFGSSAIFA